MSAPIFLRHPLLAVTALATVATLGACSGSSREGIETTIIAKGLGSAGADTTESVSFRRSDGLRIDLELGLVNLVPIELQSCSTPVALLRTLGEQLNPLAAAYAHGGETGTTVAGPLSVTEGVNADLGSLIARPGQYCGLVVELQPAGDSIAKHGEIDETLTGASLNVAPCYYAGTVGVSDAEAAAASAHSCTQAKYTGAAKRFTLAFPEPVTLDGDHRALALTIAARYEEWFDGIDLPTLATDAAQQETLAANVIRSLQVVTEGEEIVNLKFAVAVGGQEAVCGQTYEGLGSTRQPLNLQGFRFYASDFTLENSTGSTPLVLAAKTNGTVLQTADHNVALLGHAQGCDSTVPVRNLALTGTVKKAEYDRLCFSLGVPFELNHTDPATAPSPLNVTAMDWSWLFGRIFLRVDALVPGEAGGGMVMSTAETPSKAAALNQNFFVHLGSTGCSNGASDFGLPPSAECVYPNRPRICLDYADIEDGHAIVADIAPVIAELDITVNTPDTAPGCMSFPGDPECTTILPLLGLDFAASPQNLVPRREQALFKVAE